MKLHRSFHLFFLFLFLVSACHRPGPSDTGQPQTGRWKTLNDKAMEFSKSNLDSMLFTSKQLYRESVQAGDLK